MDKEKIIDLTIRVYKTTLLFPKKEPLRYKIRETAVEILAGFSVLEVFHTPDFSEFRGVENRAKDIVFDLKKNLEIISNYLEIAKWQNWVSYFDILSIKEEYDKIKFETEEIKSIDPHTKREVRYDMEVEEKKEILPVFENRSVLDISNSLVKNKIEKEKNKDDFFSEDKTSGNLDFRKQKILTVLKEKGRIQVGEISEILPEVSKRTIRRDFVQLLEQGFIKRFGEKNDTFYRLK